MAVGYLAGSWLILQVLETLLPVFDVGDTILRYIVIVLGIGFIPALAVSWAFEWTPEGLKRDDDSPQKTEDTTKHVKTWDRITFVVMALALGLFAFDRFILSPQREAELVATATEAGAEMERSKEAEVSHASVAVLPFLSMSSGEDDEYFADGLTEEILNSLSHLPGLLVTARTSAFKFKGTNEEIPIIARQLGVAHVVEGSVRRSGQQLRITAQLIRASDGFHLWSDSYDRTSEDVFAVQEDIASNVAQALDVILDDSQRAKMRKAGIRNVQAFIQFQKGLVLFLGAHGASPRIPTLRQANEHFERTMALAPEFGDAYYHHSDLFSHIALETTEGIRSPGVTDEDIENKTSYAVKIGAVTDAAKELKLAKL